jgi:DNA-nicking Smr family endonuclease
VKEAPWLRSTGGIEPSRREARDDDFREAVRDVVPLRPSGRVEPSRKPLPPIPRKRNEDEQAVLDELARFTFDDDSEIEDDSSYLRPGLPRDILRKLRRTHWVVQAHLDLHGLSSVEAAAGTSLFLADCRKRGLRCVRIVHGKGLRSPGREPVLKRRIRKLLARRGDVLAFVEPRAVHGGGGAVVVLLEG